MLQSSSFQVQSLNQSVGWPPGMLAAGVVAVCRGGTLPQSDACASFALACMVNRSFISIQVLPVNQGHVQ